MNTALENATSLYLRAIGDGEYEEAIAAYAGDRYTQHSTPVRDGAEGFVDFFEGFVRRNPVRDIEIVRSFQDGRYVFLHVLQDLNHGEARYVTADIFDTDAQGRLIEHWDVIAEMAGPNASGRTPLDGPTEPDEDHDTGTSKAVVSGFLDEALSPPDLSRLPAFVASDCAQHSAGVADGSAAWQRHLAETGLRYAERHLLVGQGDLVATLSKVISGGPDLAVVDLFRVHDGMVVEHWDVAEEIPPRSAWVNSGKF
jgi:predicted SnoaL-like aldol condensation-catalyzing enzyme